MNVDHFETDPKYDEMRNMRTGKPLSQEMKIALTKLSRGETVPLEDIGKIPEVITAFAQLENGIQTSCLSGREALQADVLKQMQDEVMCAQTLPDGSINLKGEGIKHEKRLDLIIGVPAAGKSSALAEPISEMYSSRMIDSDEAKKRIPEYHDGYGASLVHKESQKITEKHFEIALSKGENLVYQRVGRSYNEMELIISRARKYGYSVYVHYNELEKNKALGRMLERYLTTGRFLQPELYEKYGKSISDTFDKLTTAKSKDGKPLIDGYSKWDNDVPFGTHPRLVTYSSSCRKMCEALKSTSTDDPSRDKALVGQMFKNLEVLEEQLKETQAKLLASNAELEKYKNTPQALSIQAAEKFKAERDICYDKLNEMNKVFKQLPPEFARAYIKKRNELRGQSSPSLGGNDRTKPKPPKPKNPKH